MKISPGNSSISFAMTALEEFWDLSKPIVFLGEWCRLYDRRHVWEPLNAQVLPYPWDDRQWLREAIEYTDNMYERLLRILADWLNQIHGTHHGLRYWRIVIGFYLYHYVQLLYDRYLCLQQARELYPGLSTIGMCHFSYRTCCDALEFVQLCRTSDALNLQLYSQVATALGINIEQRHYVWPGKTVEPTKQISSFRRNAFKLIDAFMNRGTKSPVALYLTLMRRSILIRLVFASGLRVWPILSFDAQPLVPDRRDNELREELRKMKGPDNFGTLVLNTLAINMPLRYVEGFKTVQDAVEPLAARRSPKAIVTGLGTLYDPSFAVWAAECVERGARMIGVQHGGTYGESVASTSEKFERSVADIFVSWGWNEDNRVVALPAAKLIGISAPKNNLKKDRILWVTTADSRYPYFLSLLPIGPDFLRYFQFQQEFYRSISDELRPKLTLRLYNRDYFGWSWKKRWMDRFPDLELDDAELPFRAKAQHARMIVIDHFGATTFLEAIAMNIPVIVFGDKKTFELRDSAVPYYEELQRVGVFHWAPETAAVTVNAIYEGVEVWWSEPERQVAVRRLAHRYARTSPHAVKEWSKFVDHLVHRKAL